jgi:hypothetical protein
MFHSLFDFIRTFSRRKNLMELISNNGIQFVERIFKRNLLIACVYLCDFYHSFLIHPSIDLSSSIAIFYINFFLPNKNRERERKRRKTEQICFMAFFQNQTKINLKLVEVNKFYKNHRGHKMVTGH